MEIRWQHDLPSMQLTIYGDIVITIEMPKRCKLRHVIWGLIMFWLFLLLVSLGAILFKLGSYSILVSLFVSASKFAVLLVLCLVALLVWKKYKARA